MTVLDGATRASETAPGLEIRLVRPQEFEAAGRLAERAYSHDYAISEAYRASLLDVGPRAAEHQVWVAVDSESGSLLGTVATARPGATISHLAGAGEMDFRLLGVDPAARGRGVGEALTRHVIALAAERGLRRVVMNSGPQMLAAHRLYERLGFRRLPARETVVVESGVRLYAFGLDLPASRA